MFLVCFVSLFSINALSPRWIFITVCVVVGGVVVIAVDAQEETANLQKRCADAETRTQAAQQGFEKSRKPLEEIVRGQREELARRKVMINSMYVCVCVCLSSYCNGCVCV